MLKIVFKLSTSFPLRLMADDALQMEMAERKRHRMYFVREPSQAQSSDKIDAEIAFLIEKASKQREQLDKLELAFNEARVCSGRLGKTLQSQFMDPRRVILHCTGLFGGVGLGDSSSMGNFIDAHLKE